MEYFSERNGIYYSRNVSGGIGKSPVLRIVLSIVPLVVMGAVFFGLKEGKHFNLSDSAPIIIGAAIFIFANVLSIFLRKLGFSAGIAVDQMNGSITVRKMGGLKQTIPMDSLREIGLQTLGSKATSYSTSAAARGGVLYLNTTDGQKHVVMSGKDVIKLRMLADELSILTSTSVNEHQYTGPGS